MWNEREWTRAFDAVAIDTHQLNKSVPHDRNLDLRLIRAASHAVDALVG